MTGTRQITAVPPSGRRDTDISPPGISRAGLAAIREVLERLAVEAEHIVYGHTHRPGPLEGDDPLAWRLGDRRLRAAGDEVGAALGRHDHPPPKDRIAP